MVCEHILFFIGGKVESADHRMHFGNPRGRLGLLDGIDDAAVAARGKDGGVHVP